MASGRSRPARRRFFWAATNHAAAGQTYNIANGDVFVLRHAWPAIVAAVGGAPGGDPPSTLAAFFAEPDSAAAWARLVERHGLRVPLLPALLGQSHHYVDLLTSSRVADKSLPVLLSTIKLRQAGFAACRDSTGTLLHWLGRMADLELLPPLRTGDNAMRR